MLNKVAVIGESMLELTHAGLHESDASRSLCMKYGGDTINTTVYLCRAGIEVCYVTALGDNALSDWLLDQWSVEGVDCTLVARVKNSVPGMYMISVTDAGERSFLYWRAGSPASQLFDDETNARAQFQAIGDTPYVYLSGISLAILPEPSRHRLIGLLGEYRDRGGKVIFDGNYRPSLWACAKDARQAYGELYRLCDIALPTFDDEAQLFGYETAEQALLAIRDAGASEIVVKMGAEGCLALSHGQQFQMKAEPVHVVDTTAAGDSFNAGYLASRLKGATALDACRAGHALASKVIQYRGAIIPANR